MGALVSANHHTPVTRVSTWNHRMSTSAAPGATMNAKRFFYLCAGTFLLAAAYMLFGRDFGATKYRTLSPDWKRSWSVGRTPES